MGAHRKSDSARRKAKYAAQFDRTARNKQKNIAKLKEQNPNWPDKKDKGEEK